MNVDASAIKDMFLVEDSEGARFDTCLAVSGQHLLHISLTQDKPLLQKFNFGSVL